MTKLQEMWSYLNTHTQTTINYGMVVKLLDAVELEAIEMIDERGKEASIDADRRAEAAEARAAQLEADNDEMQSYINEIRVALHTEKDELTIDAVRRIMSKRDEALRQLSEAQHVIDAMAQIVGAADEVKHQLEQARSDIEDYRARVEELFDACEAARAWFARNTKQGHTPGPVEKMLIDAISKAEATA